jgi:prevent-host-death family protein
MKTVSARQANHEFSALLSRAEQGEDILITKHHKSVAVLSPYRRTPGPPPFSSMNAVCSIGAPSRRALR